ncbi:PAS domain-containing protein [Companilactobacillus halodurans]|uniref:YheO-like domain-containing protein n=1 Tax=Companilactobacillus halodurans TaxID=2584183 RepID=A0A5P0ZQF2_9LACO|nr:PAS domain-containing protein [Companilactobacillus halodurans]MQS76101.1 hypothetical protein [Companilactobacillus halodurans]MQS96536.1 hypothetical protein [Companilactobacillus halodurans]
MGEAQFKNADDYIKSFVPMVDFLAEVLGRNSEVVLNDVRNLDHSIVAIRNNYISHRQIGDPASDLVLRMSKQGKKESKNFLTNYSGKSSKNINL